MKRRIRPTNRVQVGSTHALVRKCGRRKQGGAWVKQYEVEYSKTGAIRTVPGNLVRRAIMV